MQKNVLYIDKPKGMTSFDVCFKLRRILGTKKIGHTGTLDPNATGVMIVLYNNACKANQFLSSNRKTYTTEVLLGVETDTLDIDGEVVLERECTMPSEDELKRVLSAFLGKSEQIPPLTSAIKINGKKLYEYQREGKEVEIPKREIFVYSIELLEIRENSFVFQCEVSGGTYIRSIVRDALEKLGIIGTVKELRRDAIDSVNLGMCSSFEEVMNGNFESHDVTEILSKQYKTVDFEKKEDIINGKRIKLQIAEDFVLITNNNMALAIYQRERNDVFKCVRGLL